MDIEKFDQEQFNFDSVAMEALSSGIGLGTLVPKTTPTSSPSKTHIVPPLTASEPLQMPKSATDKPEPQLSPAKFSWMLSLLAYFLDLAIIILSIAAAAVIVGYVLVDEILPPADFMLAVTSRFSPLQIITAISSLFLGYFLVFKILAGATLGGIIIKQK